MSQISSPSSIASAESTAVAPKAKKIGVPSNNVYTVMLAVTCLLLVAGTVLVYKQYRDLYDDASIFLTDLTPRR